MVALYICRPESRSDMIQHKALQQSGKKVKQRLVNQWLAKVNQLNYINLFILRAFRNIKFRCGSRISSRGGRAQLLRLKVADVVKRSHASEASNLWLGTRARLRALEAFGFLMLKYAFSHILETLFLSFLTSILTPKVDKNRTLEFTSINLRHSYTLHLFFNLHEKVML